MRTLALMSNADVVLVAVLTVLVVALLVFAKQLNKAIQALREHENHLEVQLDRMESATEVVAKNLASSVDRADAADDTVPGSSADAALRTGDQ